MIRIKRNSKDENGVLIKPNNNWTNRAKSVTKIALIERKRHSPDSNIYGNQEVRKALEKLFHDKCAYCETRISSGFDWEVEHYRPKGEIAENPTHPGYYWLIYKWENLFPACVHCNQKRIDKPRWNENVNTKGGKSTQFPISTELTRAMNHLQNINLEDPLLLNPCKDNPEKHFYYDPTGQIQPLNKSPKGVKSIEICHLVRSRLRKDRERLLVKLVGILKFRNMLKTRGLNQEYNELDDMIIKTYLYDDCIYSGLARYIYKFPWKFGV